MTISISKFFIFFLLVLFVFCTFLSQKSVAIKYHDNSHTYITYERTVRDILSSQAYPTGMMNPKEKTLFKPLGEGMLIEILPDQSIKVQE